MAHTPSPEPRRAPLVALITTSPLALWAFFVTQARQLRAAGFAIEAVSAPGDKLEEFRRLTGVPAHGVRFERRMHPLADLRALWSLWNLLRWRRPAIVHTHTPKAGLIGMIAAALLKIPVRIYTVNGLVLETRLGLARWVLVTTERLACRLATQVLCVSPSLARRMSELELCPPAKLRVLGSGASHGVDLAQFDPSAPWADGGRVRRRYGIPPDALVVGFAGRIVRDKGIEELAAAWINLREEFTSLHLLLCGVFESNDAIRTDTRALLSSDDRVHLTGGMISDMPSAYAAMDVVVLPSWREGLPNVALEAAAMKLPIVATRATGCVDAVADGVTGLLTTPGDAGELAQAIRALLEDPDRRQRMGEAGRRFVGERFSEREVTARLAAEYWRLLGHPSPRTHVEKAEEYAGAAEANV